MKTESIVNFVHDVNLRKSTINTTTILSNIIKRDAQDIDVLILIPAFIHDFLCIHPFNGRNGRMSRLLTTLLLYRAVYVVGRYISLKSKIAKNKNLYYDALEECGKGWHEEMEDISPFVKYLLSMILAAYRDFEERIDLIGEKLSAAELVRRAAYSKIGAFTKNDMIEICPTLGKFTVESAIKELVTAGILIEHGGSRSTFYTRNMLNKFAPR